MNVMSFPSCAQSGMQKALNVRAQSPKLADQLEPREILRDKNRERESPFLLRCLANFQILQAQGARVKKHQWKDKRTEQIYISRHLSQ